MGRADRANSFNQWRKQQHVSTMDVFDQFGRYVGIGDYVLLPGHGSVIWRVTNSTPVLHPDAPPGLVEVTFAAITQTGMQGGAPLAGLIKVRDALEYLSPEQLQEHINQARQGGPDAGVPSADAPREAGSSAPPDATPPTDSPSADSRIVLP